MCYTLIGITILVRGLNMKSIKKNYIYNLSYNLLNVLLPLLVAPYLSRVLGVEGVGTASYTLSIVSYFILFSNLGIATYGQREVSMHRDDKYEYSKKVYEIGLFRIISTLICTIVYYFLFVSPCVNQEYNVIYLILTLNILSNAFDFSWFLRGLEEFKYTSTFQIISKLLYALGIFLLVKDANDLNISILLSSMSLLLTSFLTFLTLFKYCQKVSLKQLKITSHLKDCLIYFIPAIATQIYTVLDKTMIGLFSTTIENGYYEQADKLIKVILSLLTSLNSVMQSRASYLFSKKNMEQLKKYIAKSFSFLSFLAIPLTFGIICVSSYFVPLFFGDGYDKVIINLIIISPILISIGVSNLLGSHYLTPAGKRRISNRAIVLGAIINFLLNLVLIRKYASVGAAISTIIAESIIAIMYVHYSKEVINFKDIFRLSRNNLFAGIIMSCVVLLLKQFLSISWLSLIMICGLGASIYFVILYLLKDIFLIELINMLKNKLGSVKNGKI